ncbi:MAG: CotS family spore coat protein [Clostridiales bacterium]|jgi:spore coat protein I|nr:CotS family spore coat protein [Eubacteriales bacterium]MDH7567094.1 CotS family spore coat protein [Clostridiales bacterium]
MQDIIRDIVEGYNIDVKSILPYKDAYILNTNKGKKLLKRVSYLPERILFIHGAKEHLYKNNFKCTDRYLCTVDGNPYIDIGEYRYTVSDHIEGTECNFDSKADIIAASRLLACLHRSSRGYIPDKKSMPRDDLGKLPAYFSKRLEELKKLRKAAKKGKTKFDYLFLDYADYFYNLGESVILSIPASKYGELVTASRNEGILCHHDYTHHNIMLSENKMFVINFDFCCFELKVYDLANLIRRKMRKCNWDIGEAKTIINEYRSIEPISQDEFYIMKLILQFPQKFWRVANKYYNSKHSWSEKSYLTKMQEVIMEVEYHKNFIEQFERLF